MTAPPGVPDAATPVGIVGAGAVAQTLGRRLHAAGLRVAALAARDRDRAARAAAAIDASVVPLSIDELPTRTRHVVIAVSDDAIVQVAGALARAGFARGIALHTSGAAGLGVLAPLREAGVSCGVLHPLQSIPGAGSDTSLHGAAFGVAGDPDAAAWAETLAVLAGGWALAVREEGLAAYHAAAVLTSNASAGLVDAALALMVAAGVGRGAALRALGPLGRASMDNALRDGPEAALTGPVARGDLATVRAHLAALAPGPASVSSLYRAASRQLVDLARRRGLDAGRADALDALLRDD